MISAAGALGMGFGGRGKLMGAAVPLAFLIGLSAVSTPPAALKVGDSAPDFVLKDRTGKEYRYDATVTTPTLFLSVKVNDRYTHDEFKGLVEMFEKFPQLSHGLNRIVVVSRAENNPDTSFLDSLGLDSWRVLIDGDDVFYRGYKIIATPTITLVGKDHKVVAVHPGYDAGMIQDVRLSLAKLLNVTLPSTVTEAAGKPNMSLQLGRQLAKRGLWERAIIHYEEAAKEGTLPPEGQLEMAEVYLELGQPDKAGAVVNAIPAARVDPARLARLRERIARAEHPAAVTPSPPMVTR